MLIILLLEHDHNQEYDSPWYNQFKTALWFTSSTFFFAYRDKIYSNIASVVVLVQLFLVFILTSSYTASLSSILIVQRMAETIGRCHKQWVVKNNQVESWV